MLFPHHLNSFLSTVQVEAIILLFLLSLKHLSLLLVIERRSSSSGTSVSAHARQVEVLALRAATVPSSTVLLRFLLFGLDVTHRVLHKD